MKFFNFIFVLLIATVASQEMMAQNYKESIDETKEMKAEFFNADDAVEEMAEAMSEKGDIMSQYTSQVLVGDEKIARQIASENHKDVQIDRTGNIGIKSSRSIPTPSCNQYKRGICLRPPAPWIRTCPEHICWVRPRFGWVGKRAFKLPWLPQHNFPPKVYTRTCSKPNHPCYNKIKPSWHPSATRCWGRCRPLRWVRIRAWWWICLTVKLPNFHTYKIYIKVCLYYWVPWGCHCWEKPHSIGPWIPDLSIATLTTTPPPSTRPPWIATRPTTPPTRPPWIATRPTTPPTRPPWIATRLTIPTTTTRPWWTRVTIPTVRPITWFFPFNNNIGGIAPG